MRHIAEGATIDVSLAETFVVERKALDGAGYRTAVETPDGVEHVGTGELAASQFGGRPTVQELFRCMRPGLYEIRFVSRRPWQEETHVVTSRARCL